MYPFNDPYFKVCNVPSFNIEFCMSLLPYQVNTVHTFIQCQPLVYDVCMHNHMFAVAVYNYIWYKRSSFYATQGY